MKPDARTAAPGTETGFEGADVKVDEDVIGQRLGEELVVVHLRTNQIFILNRTAARFWDLLEAGTDVAKITEILLGEFDVDPDELKRELDEFVSTLSTEELVSVRPRA